MPQSRTAQAQYEYQWLDRQSIASAGLQPMQSLPATKKTDPAGVKIVTIKQALQDPSMVEKVSSHLSAWIERDFNVSTGTWHDSAMAQRTIASWQDGLVIWVDANVVIDKSLYVLLLEQTFRFVVPTVSYYAGTCGAA